MASDVAGADIFHIRMTQGLPVRARRYREEAARFRRMAQTEAAEKVRVSLLSLAEQYDELASGIELQQHN